MKPFFSLLLVIVTLQGCASIKQPVAKRPLVEHRFSQEYEVVSKELWSSLSQKQSGSTISLNAQDVHLGRLFFSAAGLRCRKVILPQELTRIVCQDNASEQWHFVKPVISEYVEK
jgi:hypothetical protein